MNQLSQSTLIFVYNADSHFVNATIDFVTKIFVPKLYSCNLCKVTYGPAQMRSGWKDYLDTLPYEKRFLHRDEFRSEFPNHAHVALPAIFQQTSENLTLLIDSKTLDTIQNWEDLKNILKEKLAQA